MEIFMSTYFADVAVIGAGTAGLTAEHHARRAGSKTLLIDPDFLGTTCANFGCMPSKLLIAAADAAHAARDAGSFGIEAEPRVDGPAVMARLRQLRDGFARGVRRSITELPEGTCLRARARFEAPRILALDNGDRVEARTVVIATGATSAVPEPYEPFADAVLTNVSIFEIDDLPKSLGVIGAGPLGLELAQAMHRLGVHVEVFDLADRLGGLPREASDALRNILAEAFDIHLNCSAQPSPENGGVKLDWEGGAARFDKLLLAAGRPPNLDHLELEKAGLTLDDKGIPRFDPETMQCGDAPVFMAGDANHDRPVLHEASDEGTVAGRNAATWPDIARTPRKVPFSIVFTRPAAATIGMIPEPDAQGYVTGESDYSDQGRARIMNQGHGLVRLHARAGDGGLVGASLCAPAGEHLAHLLAWVIQRGLTAGDVLELPFYHPTLEEGLQTALHQICKRAGQDTPWDRNDDPLPGECSENPDK
jgi:dihydrolipoamide dehydrogenase